MRYYADLHVHSCLSPCGDLENSPTRIAERAALLGLSFVALTDHNCTFNLPTFDYACRKRGLGALFGLEVTTIEEVHLLMLFNRQADAHTVGGLVMEHLSAVRNDPERFGDQVWVDADEVVLGTVEKLLTTATDLSVDAAIALCRANAGVTVAAHIHRAPNGIIHQLGFVPPADFFALEVTAPHRNRQPVTAGGAWLSDKDLIQDFAGRRYPLVTASDAHYLTDIGRRTISSDHSRRPTVTDLLAAIADGFARLHFSPPPERSGVVENP